MCQNNTIDIWVHILSVCAQSNFTSKTIGVGVVVADLERSLGLTVRVEVGGVRNAQPLALARALTGRLPGEDITVRVAHEGKEPGQGIGYLEDGTMIVIENGARSINTEANVHVMRVLQTVGGRMIFAQPKGEVVEPRRPRPVNPGA